MLRCYPYAWGPTHSLASRMLFGPPCSFTRALRRVDMLPSARGLAPQALEVLGFKPAVLASCCRVPRLMRESSCTRGDVL